MTEREWDVVEYKYSFCLKKKRSLNISEGAPLKDLYIEAPLLKCI